jgi:hypothetical protein
VALKARLYLIDHQPAIELDGQQATLDEFATVCTRLVTEKQVKQLVLDAAELEATIGQSVNHVEGAAGQAGIRRVRDVTQQLPPGLLSRLLRPLLFSWQTKSRPAIRLDTFIHNGQVGFKITEQEITWDQLAPALAELAKERPGSELLIDAHGLEKWLDRTIGNVRIMARQAGIERIVQHENAIPFGPALAVGLMLSLLGWPWFVQHAHLVFIMFNALWVVGFAGGCAFLMLVSSYAIRVLRLMRQ